MYGYLNRDEGFNCPTKRRTLSRGGREVEKKRIGPDAIIMPYCLDLLLPSLVCLVTRLNIKHRKYNEEPSFNILLAQTRCRQ